MPTVIDTLIIQLGLDTKQFSAAQKKAVQEAKDASKKIQDSADAVQQVYSKARKEVLLFAAALLGANGIKEWFVNTTRANDATGKFAKMVGANTEELSKWQAVAERAGGSAEGMGQTLLGLTKDISQLGVLGPSESLQWINALGIDLQKFLDQKGQLKDFTGLMLALNEALSKKPPGERILWAERLHIDLQNINVLAGTAPEKLRAMLQEQEKIGFTTKDQSENSRKLVAAWTELTQLVGNFSRILIDKVTPPLTQILELVNSILKLAGTAFSFSILKQAEKYLPGLSTIEKLAGKKSEGAVAGVSPGESGGLRTKPGAGSASAGVWALARSIQNEFGVDLFTAFNDVFHQQYRSKHNEGLAADFTLKDPKQSAAVAAAIRAKFASLGIQGSVLDEYTNPSAHATGGHIHVQFASQAAADRYAAGAAGGETNFNINTVNVSANNPQQFSNELAAVSGAKASAQRSSIATSSNSAVR
jgi:hypothetical protein